ncbi:hypothetical protein [Flavobacterium polysaccharolyticum]|uniref:DUF1735 domain-containing protein n=1 Tax=Flavobacterium polysaccharolyticum TaxID=3133148 RepID=A0ABU9NJ59_9FLAO
MKKIFKSLSAVLLAVTLFSCNEGDNPIDTVLNDVTSGASLRTITVGSSSIPLGDATGKFQVTLEVQDAKNGAETDKIDVYVSFKDNSTANGSNPKPEALLKSIPSSAFVKGTRELPFADVTVTIAELQTKLGLTTAQFTGADQFVIRVAQVLKDGRVFTRANSNSNVVGGAYFSSPFQYNANVVCPITESLAGAHTFVSTNMKKGPSGSACGGSTTGTVTFGATATPGVYTISDMSFGQYGYCWGDSDATSATARVTWFCDKLVASGTDFYGETYTFTIKSASGNKITLDWINSYGDSGTTEITRAGGANWPAIFAK